MHAPVVGSQRTPGGQCSHPVKGLGGNSAQNNDYVLAVLRKNEYTYFEHSCIHHKQSREIHSQ